MAQAKPEVNKSQAIRDFVTKNPTIPVQKSSSCLPKEALKSRKIMSTPSLAR